MLTQDSATGTAASTLEGPPILYALINLGIRHIDPLRNNFETLILEDSTSLSERLTQICFKLSDDLLKLVDHQDQVKRLGPTSSCVSQSDPSLLDFNLKALQVKQRLRKFEQTTEETCEELSDGVKDFQQQLDENKKMFEEAKTDTTKSAIQEIMDYLQFALEEYQTEQDTYLADSQKLLETLEATFLQRVEVIKQGDRNQLQMQNAQKPHQSYKMRLSAQMNPQAERELDSVYVAWELIQALAAGNQLDTEQIQLNQVLNSAENGWRHSFVFGLGWQTGKIAPEDTVQHFPLDYANASVKRIELFYSNDNFFRGLVMYDAADKELMRTNRKQNYDITNKTTINLEEGERIIGIRCRKHDEAPDYLADLQFILWRAE